MKSESCLQGLLINFGAGGKYPEVVFQKQSSLLRRQITFSMFANKHYKLGHSEGKTTKTNQA